MMARNQISAWFSAVRTCSSPDTAALGRHHRLNLPSTTTQIALRLRPDAAPASYCEPPACLLHWWQPDAAMITHTSYIGRFEGPYGFA